MTLGAASANALCGRGLSERLDGATGVQAGVQRLRGAKGSGDHVNHRLNDPVDIKLWALLQPSHTELIEGVSRSAEHQSKRGSLGVESGDLAHPLDHPHPVVLQGRPGFRVGGHRRGTSDIAEQQILIFSHPIEVLAQYFAELFCGPPVGVWGVQLEQPVGDLSHGLQIETPLIAEVMEHQPVRDAGLLSDLADRNLVVPLRGELVDCDVDQALPGDGRTLLPRTQHPSKQTTPDQLEGGPTGAK